MTGDIRVGVDVSLTPMEAFDGFVDELAIALEKCGMKFEARAGGSISEGDVLVGSVEEWRAGERISMLWRPKNWEGGQQNKLLVTFSASNGGTTVTVDNQEWSRILGDDGQELLGWFASEVGAQLLSVSAPIRFGDWITDRSARRPSGARSRGIYGNPTYHWPNFFVILDQLSLRPDDFLLEIGCGGGAFLHEALKSGCRGAALDHSVDMIRVATEANRDAITSHRLTVARAEADKVLPFPDDTFTCTVMTSVLAFLSDPSTTFREMFRVLRNGGRIVIFTSTKELEGTPAAPEPIASRLHFYEDEELEKFARQAGFSAVRVEHPSLFEYAKKAGVPASDLQLFSGTSGSQLLLARKDQGK